jgi:RNA polymerase sigma-70 factor (ECF subfamily)
VQAAIAALHAQAPAWEATDWPQIAGLYAELERHDPSPVVTVNRAVAVGFADGPEAGIALLEALDVDARLARYGPVHAARADLLRRAGDAAGADAAYERAIALSSNQAEREALSLRRRDASVVSPPRREPGSATPSRPAAAGESPGT